MQRQTSAREQGTGSDSIELSTITTRQSRVGGIEAFSGARLELVELPTGRRVVLKHLPPPGDRLTRATDGSRVPVVVIDVAGCAPTGRAGRSAGGCCERAGGGTCCELPVNPTGEVYRC